VDLIEVNVIGLQASERVSRTAVTIQRREVPADLDRHPSAWAELGGQNDACHGGLFERFAHDLFESP